jgi:phosphoadenosine phosphosulfate reductase
LAVSLQLPADLESRSAEEILAFLLQEVPGRVALACSFQKEETVLLDMLFALEPRARVFALDTHVLFPETYALWREAERRYGTTIEVFEGPSLGRQAAAHGEALWARNPDLCCAIRKVEPLNRALAGLDAWITGLRRDQSPSRADAPKLGWDERHELWKANPLADWTDEQCWAYIRERDLP